MDTADHSALDTEVRRPQDDLLEMQVAARELARQIPSKPKPYTIGIFGEWGSGKTSFAQLVNHYLTDAATQPAAPIFVDFSAWPFHTSDEVWRALLLRIAECLFAAGAQPAAGKAAAAEPPGEGFAGRLARLLRRDALVLAAPEPGEPAEVPRLATYRDVIDRLDQTSVDIRRGEAQGARLDQEKTLLAGLGVAVAALGSLSPLVAGLRGLLGLEAPKPAELLQRERNEATRDRIDSIARLRAIVKQLFAEQAAGRCVCVFVDDLDRCMPDTALDLLEAIKVFLVDTPCVFLVAADEHLIGNALQLRFKDLAHTHGRRGAEYLEKIIQLSIPVPPPSPAQSRRLIAAQFPRWLAAADILVTALGTNPRRLKQYCAFLSYRYEVAALQSGRTITPAIARLEKLIQIRSWDTAGHCLAALAELAVGKDGPDALARLEQHCGVDDPKASLPLLPASVSALARGAAEMPAVRRLIAEPPLLSAATAEELSILLGVADLEPDPDTILATRDAPTLRLLKALEVQESLTAGQILREDFTRLLGLRELPRKFLDALGEIAASATWTATMLALEAALDARVAVPPPDLPAAAREICQRAIDEVTGEQRSPVAAVPAVTGVLRAKLIDEEPRLSRLLSEEVTAFLGVLPALPTADTLLAADVRPSDEQRNRTVALELIRIYLADSTRLRIETGIEYRLAIARHVHAVRRFAKLDALRYRWPRLERLLWTHRFHLLALERDALAAEPKPAAVTEEGGDLAPHDASELAEFFRLRPWFRDIYPEDHRQFLKAVAATSPQAVAAPPAGAALPPSAPAPTGDAAPQVHAVPIPHRVVEVTIDDPTADSPNADDFPVTYTWDRGGETTQVMVHLPVATLLALADSPKRDTALPPFGMSTRDLHLQTRLPLREIGMRLYDWLFGDSRLPLDPMDLLQGSSPTRLLLRIKAAHLPRLAWETLYMPSRRQHLVLSRSFSLVRYSPSLVQRPPATFAPPLRLLAVFPQPGNLAPLNVQGEEHSLLRTLGPVIDRRLVQVQVLGAGSATPSNLLSTLRVFQPHLFHFVGHGAFQPEAGEGALMFESEDGGAAPLRAGVLRDYLADGMLQAAVLNACDTGVAAPSDPISGLASALVLGGVPAVIATMRPVADPQAVLFAREFYRAFVDGYSIEEALAEARKAMTIEGWDWSLYALFSGIKDLDFLRFAP